MDPRGLGVILSPVFSAPWDGAVLTLPKFNVVGIEGVYVSSGEDRGAIGESSNDLNMSELERGEKNI